MNRRRWMSIGACAFLLPIASCGGAGSASGTSGGGVDIGTGSGDAIGDLLDTFSSVRVVLRNPIVTLLAPMAISQHVHCTSGGQADMGGTLSGDETEGAFSISGDFSYQSCDSQSGTGNFDGTFSTSGGQRNFTGALSGTIGGNGCSTILGGATYSFPLSSDTSLIEPPSTGTAGGTMAATCTEPAGSAAVSCDWGSGADVNSSSALRAGCTCSGAGCG